MVLLQTGTKEPGLHKTPSLPKACPESTAMYPSAQPDSTLNPYSLCSVALKISLQWTSTPDWAVILMEWSGKYPSISTNDSVIVNNHFVCITARPLGFLNSKLNLKSEKLSNNSSEFPHREGKSSHISKERFPPTPLMMRVAVGGQSTHNTTLKYFLQWKRGWTSWHK